MIYKTTHFKLSSNAEISTHDSILKRRINIQLPIKELNDLYNMYEKYPNNVPEIREKSITELQNILDFLWPYYKDLDKNKASVSYLTMNNLNIEDFNRLTKIVVLLEEISNAGNSRFSHFDEIGLNEHMNQIACEGWKMLSFQSVVKGTFGQSYNEGYGVSYTDGFVMVWEKSS